MNMASVADIAAYLRSEGQCDRLLVSVDREESAAQSGGGVTEADVAAPIVCAIEIDGVQVDTRAGPSEMAWSKRAGAAAEFRGGLLLCDPRAAVGAEASSPRTGQTAARAFIVCSRPRLAMALAVRRFFAHLLTDRQARFHSAEQRAQAAAAGAWVMNAAVAAGVTFGPQCSVGCSGMGYERREDGVLVGFPQLGTVILEEDVEIAAHATVQRGAIGATRICRGAKIGPHVNVGHNVEVGPDVLITGHVQIGGGARIGAGAVLWQSCAIANGVTIGEGAVIGMGAQVLRDVPAGETWVGNPARPLRRAQP